MWLALLAVPAAHADDPYWNSKPVSYWVGVLQTGQPAERLHAARGLNELAAARGGEAVDGLRKLVGNDPDPQVRAHAARSLGQIAPADADVVETCALALGKDQAATVRQAAAAVLLQAGPAAEKGRPALVGALSDGDATVRVFAAGAVGQFGDAATALPVLLGGLRHEDAMVRAEAAGLLSAVPAGYAAAVPALTDALRDPDPAVRLAAAESLGHIGAPARPAIEPLWRLMRDPDEDVREAALRAIRLIRE